MEQYTKNERDETNILWVNLTDVMLNQRHDTKEYTLYDTVFMKFKKLIKEG